MSDSRESGFRAAILRPVLGFRLRREQRQAVRQGRAHPLTSASPGQPLRVAGVAGEHAIEIPGCFSGEFALDAPTRRRLMELGLVPGARVCVLSQSEPVLLSLYGGRTALDRSLAQSVFVVRASDLGRSECAADLAGEEVA